MPCRHCNIDGHNIKTCEIFGMERAVSIVNDYKDIFTESEEHVWFHNRLSNSTYRPSNKEWWLYDPINWSRIDSTRYRSVLNCILKIKWLKFENLDLTATNGRIKCYGGDIYIRRQRLSNGETREKVIFERAQGPGSLNSSEQKRRSENHKKEILAVLNLRAEQIRRARIRHAQEQRENARLQREQQARQLEEQRQAARQRQRDEQARRAAMTETERLSNLTLVTEAIETTECPVCMDDLGNTNKVVLRCGHQFCGDCLFKHLQMPRGTNCPMCRAEYTIRPRGWLPPGAPAAAHTHSPRRDQNVTGRTDERERQLLMRQNEVTNLRLENLETILQQMAANNVRINIS